MTTNGQKSWIPLSLSSRDQTSSMDSNVSSFQLHMQLLRAQMQLHMLLLARGPWHVWAFLQGSSWRIELFFTGSLLGLAIGTWNKRKVNWTPSCSSLPKVMSSNSPCCMGVPIEIRNPTTRATSCHIKNIQKLHVQLIHVPCAQTEHKQKCLGCRHHLLCSHFDELSCSLFNLRTSSCWIDVVASPQCGLWWHLQQQILTAERPRCSFVASCFLWCFRCDVHLACIIAMHLDRHFPVSLLLIHINQQGGNRNGRTGRGDQLQPLEFPGPRRCRATTQSATAASALGPAKSTSLIPHLSNLLYSFQTSPKTGLMKNSRSDFQLVRDLQKFRSTHPWMQWRPVGRV